MELALITAQQVAVLFLLIGTCMVAVKTGVLKLENKQALSNLLWQHQNFLLELIHIYQHIFVLHIHYPQN